MKIKKFIAENLKVGKSKIVAELGDEAVILSSRVIQDPESGQEFVEIVAALDESALSKEHKKATDKAIESIKSRNIESSPIQALQGAIKSDKSNELFKKQFEELKSIIADLSDNVKIEKKISNNEIINQLYIKLRELNFTEKCSRKLVGSFKEHEIPMYLREALITTRKKIAESIIVHNPLKKSNISQVCLFIGPTGSGKSTSLIKLALISKIVLNSNVMIISADTHKVGGAEQLETYASIASISFKTVYSNLELNDTISREQERDFIFVDTAGKNFKDSNSIKELEEFSKSVKFSSIYLVVPSNHMESYYRAVIEAYSSLKPTSLIITKIDESDSLGELYSGICENNTPISYITTGQQIPDNIEPADKSLLAKLILPDLA